MLSQQQVVPTPTAFRDADRAARSLTETAVPKIRADVPCAWQAAALAAYAQEVGEDGAHLRAELAARVSALTGCAIPESTITADAAARRATGAMDGVVFQLQGHTVILLQHCAHCGTGRFASPPIEGPSDLGYALAAWAPYHPDCVPVDPADDASW